MEPDEERMPVALSFRITPPVEDDMSPFGASPILSLRCVHLDTGAVLTVEVPTGVPAAVEAAAAMGGSVLDMMLTAMGGAENE